MLGKYIFAQTALALIIACLSTSAVLCRPIHVGPDGDDVVGTGLTWSSALQTVQAGINKALPGDEVWVAADVYVERVALKPGVSLYGGFAGYEDALEQRDPKKNLSIIDANKKGAALATPPAPFAPILVDGFVIRNGKSDTGGGVISTSDALTLSNNVITGHISCSGVYGTARVLNNLITGNTIGINATNGEISGNRIENNTYYGIQSSNTAVLKNTVSSNRNGMNCTGGVISGNIAYGNANTGIGCTSAVVCSNTAVANGRSGIYCSGTTALSNNITAYNAVGITWNSYYGGACSLSNNCVFNPDGSDYSGIAAGSTDISIDPKLADWQGGNLHIQPDSPCIDAGWNDAPGVSSEDLDAQPRIIAAGGIIDIGADESDGTTWDARPRIIRVDGTSGSDTADGSSWATARKTIQSAVNAAAQTGGEVWVRCGVYHERITLKQSIRIYGGFAGREDSREQRNWAANRTVIDGDQIGSVVTLNLVGRKTCALSGFTISNGRADMGGGIYCSFGSPDISDNVIANCAAGDGGGGVYCSYAFPVITDNVITGCTASFYGAGICCSNSSPLISHNTITSNGGRRDLQTGGGAIASIYSSSPAVSGNSITNNSSTGNGAGIYIYEDSSATVSGNVIAGNSSAGNGGGMFCSGTAVVCGNTIAANSARIGGGMAFGDHYYEYTCSCQVSNNIVAFNSSGVAGGRNLRNNCVYNPDGSNYLGVGAGNGDISADPLFASREYGNYHLAPNSPCIDAGRNDAAGISAFDIDGQPRIDAAVGVVDIGADEFDGTIWTAEPRIVRVSPTGSDANDGSSWTLAMRTVQAGLNVAAKSGGEVWVASGTYHERIELPQYVYLYGGFAGNEGDGDSRDWRSNATVLDGDGGGSVVIGSALGCNLSAIDGFTICNGAASDGGGIYCRFSPPVISNNCITENRAAGFGGGIWYWQGPAKILNNLVTHNTAQTAGGGIWNLSNESTSTISGNTITDNSAGYEGGGLSLYGNATLVGNLVCRNTAEIGAGVYVSSASSSLAGNWICDNAARQAGGGIWSAGLVSVVSNTIARNAAPEAGGAHLESCSFCNNIVAHNSSGLQLGTAYGTSSLSHNVFYNPGGYDYLGTQAGSTDVSADPKFVDLQNGNYHLQSGSPCIDKGVSQGSFIPAIDIDGQPRVFGRGIDIGADEWVPSSQVKLAAPGPTTVLPDMVVTASFPGYFYVESRDRTCGIRVYESKPHTWAVGTAVNLTGTTMTHDSEYCFLAYTVTPTGSGKIEPLALSNKAVGGGPFGYQEGIWGWVRALDAAGGWRKVRGVISGLNNMGLLVRAWGKFTKVSDSRFSIDDGSGLGIQCVVPPGVILGQDWKTLQVTGISSVEAVSAYGHRELRPLIIIRSQDDIIAQ